ncbi:MAG: protein kinase, partial [Polyangiaceae bacterium]
MAADPKETLDSTTRRDRAILTGPSHPWAGREGMGTLAGRYKLHALLGRGGNGEVWEAEDRLSTGRVAVKILDRGRGAAAARVRREVSALRLLHLPGVVHLLDEGVESGRAYLVMERVNGEPFPGVPAPAAWERIEPVVTGLLETLSRIHAAGVVHRDLKPANVLVTPEGRPVVLDFGISHMESAGDQDLT